jgi:hypothetical protein
VTRNPLFVLDRDSGCAPAHSGDRLAGPRIHPLFPVVVGHEAREILRKDARADPIVREEHRDPAALQGERRRDLGADEASSDHREVPAAWARARRFR